MTDFKLDSRLQNDCFVMAESDLFMLLLMNNRLVPWFILVPKTDQTEIYQLDNTMQMKVLDMINQLSQFVNIEFRTDKLNVAAIGNVVNQMHIHIVGRYKTDPYWPGVVWGASEKETYNSEEVEQIKISLDNILEI